MVRENCGVFGAFSTNGNNVIPFVIDCLRALQHRGQEAWGIAIPRRMPFKRLGLVSASGSEFKSISKKYRSDVAIGHVRYSTFGKSTLSNAQPIKVKDLCIAHNGTIANVEEMSGMVGGCTFTPHTMSDTLVAAQRLIMHLDNNHSMKDSISILKSEMVGSFCFVFLTDDGSVYAARDPRGFRPMVLGTHLETNTFMIASESCAFSAVGANLIRDVEPGEIIKLDRYGIKSEHFANESHSHCAFEFTYFAHPTSIMEGVNVYLARKRIGQLLAKKYPILDADLVIPVPDSARPAALGYSEALGLPIEEGLLKNRYSKKGSMRSFIEPYGETRVEINKGIIPIRELIHGNKIVVIDDSIVRGTSSHSIVKMLREAGAKEISVIVTYPPIRFPCYAGIDFPSQEELIAYQETKNEDTIEKIGSNISKIIGADFTGYNDTSSLAQAIGIPEDQLCFTCSTGDYSSLGIKPIFRTRKQMKGEE